VTIEPTPTKGMRLSLAVIREMKGEGDKEVKDEESRDI
jgi:hypothetical protein